MGKIHRRSRGKRRTASRLAALLLCLSLLTGVLPALAQASDGKARLSDIVTFDSITLHHTGPDGQSAGEEVEDGALLKKNAPLILRYTYAIDATQCGSIQAGTNYYLEVSPHLVLPNLTDGSELTIETDEGTVPFGRIFADGTDAWVTFDAKAGGTDTVLSDYGELENAYFYLNCHRAGSVPAGETPIDGNGNLYAMKFENNDALQFGYAENQPVTARAQIQKGGSLTDKTITWTIDYTPWQNPGPNDPVDLDTPFELRDIIDTTVHSYVLGSVKIDGTPVADGIARPTDEVDAYVLMETLEDGKKTILTFGGAKFHAGQATAGNPATPLQITYETTIHDELLLPGGTGGKKVTNAAELLAGQDGAFNSLGITSSKTVEVPQPTWLTKEGDTTRSPGNGATTTWKVVFHPNGFGFNTADHLTLHDQLPAGSTLVDGSVQVDGVAATATVGADNSFTVSPITASGQPVTVTYQTHVPESMYDSGTSLGSNTAYFTFDYGEAHYTTPQVETPVGSGDGSHTPGTATLVKANTGYRPASRSIDWTVTINPHKANLRSGTFTDDLKIGTPCEHVDHGCGLALANGVSDIRVLVDGQPDNGQLVTLDYEDQKITITVGEVGAKTVTLAYTTQVCDPCIFANNTGKASFTNTVSTTDMLLGATSTEPRSASAASTADVGATVLTKRAPVYDYASGRMKWTVEVNAAGLSMEDVVLTDDLPAGLTYVEDSLATSPALAGATAGVSGQTLTIDLGTVTGNTTITFDTAVDPERLGFGGDQPVVVENTIHMNGQADGVEFAEVSHRVQQRFSNHGLVKKSDADNAQELIQYEVLINPYHLTLPNSPALIDTLDKRLQLDTDTLMFYEAALTGTTINNGQRPGYTKLGDGQALKVHDFDPAANCFTVQLPISADDRGTYVLTYSADIIERQAGGYSNSVRFDGGSVLLGGSKNNSATVGGGGGGGGGGVAARKAKLSVVKTDQETQTPLSGVSFLLYQWDGDARGLPFAQGTTDEQGKLTFLVKPNAVYELVETGSAPGYGSELGWIALPAGAEETADGLRLTAGAARSELTLHLTNEAHTTDLVFRLVNAAGIPMAGAKVHIFPFDPTGMTDPTPAKEATVSPDGTVKFPSVRRGAVYYIQRPDGGVLPVDVPAQEDAAPTVTLPDGTMLPLDADYRETGVMDADQQWALTVHKVVSGGDAPLAGATIGLYADAACKTLLQTGISGPDGTIAFSGLIKGQAYWLQETQAPSGYQISTEVYEATEEVPAVTIENTPSPVAPPAPTRPSTPSEPDTPTKPSTPIELETPAEPETLPVDSAEPEIPEKLPTELPDPNAPDAPEEVTILEEGVPKTYRKAWDAETGAWIYLPEEDVPLYFMDVPKTGDPARLMAMVTLAAAIALTILTGYRFAARKREKSKMNR